MRARRRQPRFRPAEKASAERSAKSVLELLRDEPFIRATSAFAEIVGAFEEEVGRKPTLGELCEVLTWGARGCSTELIQEAPNRAITIVGAADTKTYRQRPRRGDLICIPLGAKGFGIVVYLGRFQSFGDAFGLFKQALAVATVSAVWQPLDALARPVYADPEYMYTGRWAAAGNRADLIDRFRTPEAYYDPAGCPAGMSYGEHGIAESPSGDPRAHGGRGGRHLPRRAVGVSAVVFRRRTRAVPISGHRRAEGWLVGPRRRPRQVTSPKE